MDLFVTSAVCVGVVLLLAKHQGGLGPRNQQKPVTQPLKSYAPSQTRPTSASPKATKDKVETASERIGREGEAKVRQIISDLKLEAFHDILLFTKDSITQIDHLVKTPHGIVAIETKNYTGFIFVSTTSGNWIQQTEREGKTYRTEFHSPVKQNEYHLTAVRQALEHRQVPVISHVVFIGDAVIGETAKPYVTSPYKLGHQLWRPEIKPIDSSNLEAAWERLFVVSKAAEQFRPDHAALFHKSRQKRSHET